MSGVFGSRAWGERGDGKDGHANVRRSAAAADRRDHHVPGWTAEDPLEMRFGPPRVVQRVMQFRPGGEENGAAYHTVHREPAL